MHALQGIEVRPSLPCSALLCAAALCAALLCAALPCPALRCSAKLHGAALCPTSDSTLGRIQTVRPVATQLAAASAARSAMTATIRISSPADTYSTATCRRIMLCNSIIKLLI